MDEGILAIFEENYMSLSEKFCSFSSSLSNSSVITACYLLYKFPTMRL
jgi:hypothetical protein